MDILDEIIARKRKEVDLLKSSLSLSSIKDQLVEDSLDPEAGTRGFLRALNESAESGRPGVIAEIKKASPSKGLIRSDFDVASIAGNYEDNNASCLSVLTEQHYFQGNNEYLKIARKLTNLPVLRKDFIVDPWQIFESRLLRADCVLLIVSALSDEELSDFNTISRSLSMDVLVEVHDEQELERALAISPDMIGINNRNLRTFETNLDTTIELKKRVPPHCLVITESGIRTNKDVEMMLGNKINSFLVGETFMRAENPGDKLKELFFVDSGCNH